VSELIETQTVSLDWFKSFERRVQEMKSARRWLTLAVSFIALRVLLASSIGVLVLGISFAHALTVAYSTISLEAGDLYNPDYFQQVQLGPTPIPLLGYAATEGVAYEGNSFYRTLQSFQTSALMNVDFTSKYPVLQNPNAAGPGSVVFGTVAGDGMASAQISTVPGQPPEYRGFYDVARGYGLLTTYFTIKPKQASQFLPADFPLLLYVAGDGELSDGFGSFSASVEVGHFTAGEPAPKVAATVSIATPPRRLAAAVRILRYIRAIQRNLP
jgi:hypothetical protein